MQALDFARLAARAYTDAPTVGDPDSASRMHVYDLDGEIIHAFRGTDDFASIVADADIATIHVPGLGELHAGFYGAIARILPACLALPAPTVILGHSLGAAMAEIYAGVYALQGRQVPVYAFEPPRLCKDSILRDLLKSEGGPAYATRNGNDVVTQVPLGFEQAWPLVPIGTASLPVDNVEDHMIARVIAALGG